jgi:hypothetical protein
MNNPTAIAQWGPQFEDLLDAALATFSSQWRLPDAPARIADSPDHHLGWRCNRKRMALVAELAVNSATIRVNRSLFLRLIVHDLNPSFNRFLIEPIVNALGVADVHDALIHYVENGTLVEQFGAVRAWYSAQPGLHYPTTQAHDSGDPSLGSSLAYSDWMALWPRYEEACRRAVRSCTDPAVRAQLVDEMNAFSEVRKIGNE